MLAGSVIAAGCNAMFQGLKAIITLVTGLLPGNGRGSLMLTAAETVIALAIILFTGVFLGIFLQVVQALFRSGSGESFPKTFAIVAIVLIDGASGSTGPVDIGPVDAHPTASGPGDGPGSAPRRRLPGPRSGRGSERAHRLAVLGTLARAGTRAALAAASGGTASVATAAAAGVKAGGVANDARRLTRAAPAPRRCMRPVPAPPRDSPRKPLTSGPASIRWIALR